MIAESWSPPCSGVGPGLVSTPATSTNGQGAFRLLVAGLQEGTQCAQIRARFEAAEVSDIVTMTMQPAGSTPLDSVRVDLTLP